MFLLPNHPLVADGELTKLPLARAPRDGLAFGPDALAFFFQCQLALAAALNIFPQRSPVRCQHDDVFSAARNADIPLLLARRRPVPGIGDDDGVSGLAL